MKDICIIQANEPDLLLRIGEALGDAAVNIEGLSLTRVHDDAIVHLLVDDEDCACKALEQRELCINKVSEIVLIDKDLRKVTAKPGSFATFCRLFNENGLKIHFGYPAENNRFVFGVDDPQKAQQLLG